MVKGYLQAFQDLGDRARIVASVDPEPSRAAEVSAAFPEAMTAADYHEVLPEVDAVALLLPHHLHHPIGRACLAAGKHVLMEKPLANSEQECVDLIAAAEKANRTLMVAYCMRFHPLLTKLKELLDEQAYGEVFQLSIWTEQHTQYPPEHWASNAATLGGGQLFSHGCHYIDLLLWFLGAPIEGAHVGTNLGTPWMQREGTSNVAIRFESGALGYHFGTWGARGTRLGYAIHVHCSEGMLEAAISDGKLLLHQGEEIALLAEAPLKKPIEFEVAHFLDCIDTGAAPLTNGPDSLVGLQVIWRLYEAERVGRLADLRGLELPSTTGR